MTLEFDFQPKGLEVDIVEREPEAGRDTATELVRLARWLRNLQDQGLVEVPSTRLLISTAQLIGSGVGRKRACLSGIMGPLTDDPDLQDAIRDVIEATF